MAAFKRILPPGSARVFSPIPSGNRPTDHTVEDKKDLNSGWVRFAPGRGQFDCSRDDLFDCTTRDHLDQEVKKRDIGISWNSIYLDHIGAFYMA